MWILRALRAGNYTLTISDSARSTITKEFSVKGMYLRLNSPIRSPLPEFPVTGDNTTTLSIERGTAPFRVTVNSYTALRGQAVQPLTIEAQGANRFKLTPKPNIAGAAVLRVTDANGAYEQVTLDIDVPRLKVWRVGSEVVRTGGDTVTLRVAGGLSSTQYRVTTSRESVLKFNELIPGYFVGTTTMLPAILPSLLLMVGEGRIKSPWLCIIRTFGLM